MSVDKFGRYSVTGEKPNVLNRNSGLPLTAEGDYNIGNKRLKSVKDPQDNNDAINLKTLKKELSSNLRVEGNDTYNAKNCRIINIADPHNKQDCVTKGYADTLTSTSLKLEGDTYNAKGKLIQNVGDPLLPSDVVTMRYMEKNTPTQHNDYWNFAGKRLSSIKEPIYDGEAVNLATMKSLTICKTSKTDKYFDANNLQLSNIGDCVHDGDAVNKRMLYITSNEWMKQYNRKLERLGSALFHYIHRSTGRAADPQVHDRNYLDWPSIHDPSHSTPSQMR